jgi:hypothetical protein
LLLVVTESLGCAVALWALRTINQSFYQGERVVLCQDWWQLCFLKALFHKAFKIVTKDVTNA